MSDRVVKLARAGGDPNPPPAGLGKEGKALWVKITRDFLVDDAGARAVLHAACQAADISASCEQQIQADGMMIAGRGGMKDNPLIRQQIAALALGARLLEKLGCLQGAPQPVGRPGGSRFT